VPLFTASSHPQAQPSRLLAFGLSYCLLHVGTVFLRYTSPIGLTLGDWISLLAPWLVMGSALLVWDTTPASVARHPGLVALLLGSALLYATGLGINLSAHAIGRLIDETAPSQPAQLVYFLDEHLGHVLWHLGMIGVSVALLLGAVDAPPGPGGAAALWLGAPAYAFAYFTEAVEGQTVALLLPVSLLVVLGLLVRRLRVGPLPLLHRFMLVGHGLALAQFLTWRLWQGGFPQFSEVWGL
jgi:hypothetical protein